MTWQTEFDEMYQHITNEKNRLIYKGYQYVTVHACIKAFIQDLLDRKAREIEGLKIVKPQKDNGLTYPVGALHKAYNDGLADALSILEEEK